jgi:hypothetical protein
MNLRAIGIVLIAIFSSLLALASISDFSVALGILGAIAGYLFGTTTDPKKTVVPAQQV